MRPRHGVTATLQPANLAVVAAMAMTLVSACSGAASAPSPSSQPTVATTPAPTDTPALTPTAPPPSATAAPPMPTPIAGAPDSGIVLKLTASGHAWDLKELAGPAGGAFKIAVTNKDGDPHNLVIASGTEVASRLATLAKFSGPDTKTLDVPGLPAGTYLFRCTLHDSMRGELTIK
jgi:cupredoxin-like protein